MKIKFLAPSLLLSAALFSTSAMAWSYDNDSSDSYQGYSGSSYQYDLSDPSDQNDYSIDLDAQQRDQMSLDTGRSLDQGMGQYGGGIYDD